MGMSPSLRGLRSILSAALPVAAAIGVFGVIYGAAATQVMGPTMTVVSSAIVFSGAAQFTMVGLVAAGAGPVGVLGAVLALGMRHLALGAVLRPRITASRPRRGLLSWFLIDETTGLALALDQTPERTLVVGGAMAYAAWVAGTIAGAAGGEFAAIEPLAAALFPVLFIGLAALTATTRSDAGRALASGGLTVLTLAVWPSAGAVVPLAVALLVATTVRRR